MIMPVTPSSPDLTARLRGIYPALVTPCLLNSECLDLPALANHLDRLLATDIQGLYICGASGDFPRLTLDERMQVAELACEKTRLARRIPIVQIGHENPRDAVRLAQHAARCGAAAISSVPPASVPLDLLPDYYRTLVDASGLQLLIYYAPGLMREAVGFADLERWLGLSGICGLKYSALNPYWIRRLRQAFPDTTILSGPDELLATNLGFGADGGIGFWYNLIPEYFIQIYRLVAQGRMSEAVHLQNLFVDAADLAWRDDIEDVFEAYFITAGYGERCFRSPRQPEVQSRIDALLPAFRAAISILQAEMKQIPMELNIKC